MRYTGINGADLNGGCDDWIYFNVECSRCGYDRIGKDDNFCSNCGYKLEKLDTRVHARDVVEAMNRWVEAARSDTEEEVSK